MVKVEYYRQIFSAFKELCATGQQSCSFREYCLEHKVSFSKMYQIVREEFPKMSSIPGYRKLTHLGFLYSKVYEEYKNLCFQGKQPGSFTEYCGNYGITWKKMSKYLWRNKLTVVGLPGYTDPRYGRQAKSRYKEIPFEDVIFEEAGFLPAESRNVITVRVDGNVEVSFPADTDLCVIAKFIRKMEKEAGHVGS